MFSCPSSVPFKAQFNRAASTGSLDSFKGQCALLTPHLERTLLTYDPHFHSCFLFFPQYSCYTSSGFPETEAYSFLCELKPTILGLYNRLGSTSPRPCHHGQLHHKLFKLHSNFFCCFVSTIPIQTLFQNFADLPIRKFQPEFICGQFTSVCFTQTLPFSLNSFASLVFTTQCIYIEQSYVLSACFARLKSEF